MPVPLFLAKAAAHPRTDSQNFHWGFLLTETLCDFRVSTDGFFFHFMSHRGGQMEIRDTIIIYIEEVFIKRVPKHTSTTCLRAAGPL